MSNQAVFRATTGCRACSERLDFDGDCSCSRSRQAVKLRPAEQHEFRVGERRPPPDAYSAAIARRQAELGYPVVPEQRPEAPARTARISERPAFPMKPNPAPDGYAAQIATLRRRRGIKPAPSLPADYRAGGPPPDPYAAQIAAARAQEVA